LRSRDAILGLPVACAGRLRPPCSACRGGRVGASDRLPACRDCPKDVERSMAGLRQSASA